MHNENQELDECISKVDDVQMQNDKPIHKPLYICGYKIVECSKCLKNAYTFFLLSAGSFAGSIACTVEVAIKSGVSINANKEVKEANQTNLLNASTLEATINGDCVKRSCPEGEVYNNNASYQCSLSNIATRKPSEHCTNGSIIDSNLDAQFTCSNGSFILTDIRDDKSSAIAFSAQCNLPNNMDTNNTSASCRDGVILNSKVNSQYTCNDGELFVDASTSSSTKLFGIPEGEYVCKNGKLDSISEHAQCSDGFILGNPESKFSNYCHNNTFTPVHNSTDCPVYSSNSNTSAVHSSNSNTSAVHSSNSNTSAVHSSNSNTSAVHSSNSNTSAVHSSNSNTSAVYDSIMPYIAGACTCFASGVGFLSLGIRSLYKAKHGKCDYAQTSGDLELEWDISDMHDGIGMKSTKEIRYARRAARKYHAKILQGRGATM